MRPTGTVILLGLIQGERINILAWVVDQLQARRLFEDLAG
jgi:hypothetical protein